MKKMPLFGLIVTAIFMLPAFAMDSESQLLAFCREEWTSAIKSDSGGTLIAYNKMVLNVRAKIEAKFSGALEHLKSKNFARGIADLDEIIALGNVECEYLAEEAIIKSHYTLGNLCTENGAFDKAIDHFKKATRFDKRHVEFKAKAEEQVLASYEISRMYQRGNGVKKSLYETVLWLERTQLAAKSFETFLQEIPDRKPLDKSRINRVFDNASGKLAIIYDPEKDKLYTGSGFDEFRKFLQTEEANCDAEEIYNIAQAYHLGGPHLVYSLKPDRSKEFRWLLLGSFKDHKESQDSLANQLSFYGLKSSYHASEQVEFMWREDLNEIAPPETSKYRMKPKEQMISEIKAEIDTYNTPMKLVIGHFWAKAGSQDYDMGIKRTILTPEVLADNLAQTYKRVEWTKHGAWYEDQFRKYIKGRE